MAKSAMIGMALLVAGCGQKYPTAYGLYMRDGSKWIPVSAADKECVISSKPEFLLFDARIGHAAGKPDTDISLKPLKWLRWNITGFVVRPDAPAHRYEKSSVGEYVPYGSNIPMTYSPVKNQQNMLIASPLSPLIDGCFTLNYYDEKVICINNVEANPDQWPETLMVDRWVNTYDKEKGFSWDAFLAESMNGGRAVFAEGIRPSSDFTSLIDSLRQQCSELASDHDAHRMITFCKMVEKLDEQLYAVARKQCLASIEAEMKQAAAGNDYARAVGVGLMGLAAGMLTDAMIKELDGNKTALASSEESSVSPSEILAADRSEKGTELLSSEYSRRGWTYKALLSDRRVTTYLDGKDQDGMDGWFGNIRYIHKNKEYLVCRVSRGGGAYAQVGASFKDEAECERFTTAAEKAWEAWHRKWEDHLAIEVKVRPHFWSERIVVGDLPYAIEPVHGSQRLALADVSVDAPLNTRNILSVTNGLYRMYWKLPQGQFRLRTIGSESIRVRVRLCPIATSDEISRAKSQD